MPVSDDAPSGRAALPQDVADLPPLGPAFDAALTDGLDRLAITLSAGARAAIEAHARLLLAWNSAINLTALREPEQVARLHILDSLSALAVLRAGARGWPPALAARPWQRRRLPGPAAGRGLAGTTRGAGRLGGQEGALPRDRRASGRACHARGRRDAAAAPRALGTRRTAGRGPSAARQLGCRHRSRGGPAG